MADDEAAPFGTWAVEGGPGPLSLLVTRGLPGAGKSTYAKAWVEGDPNRRARVNRDLLRDLLANGRYGDQATEHKVDLVQEAIVHALLSAGYSVIVDNTHLYDGHMAGWRAVANRHRAELVVVDMRDVSVEECIRRDAARPALAGRCSDSQVGERYIRAAHAGMTTTEMEVRA